MRKPRDIDTELKALQDRAKALKAKRKSLQLGELIVATGADSLDPEVLAGVLLHGVAEAKVEPTREAWRIDGAAFFRRKARKSAGSADGAGAQSAAIGDGAETR